MRASARSAGRTKAHTPSLGSPRVRWTLLTVLLAIALAGCEAPPTGAGTPVCGSFSLGLETSRIKAGDDAGLHVRLENCGTKDLSIGLVPHCQQNALSANVTIGAVAYDITQGAARSVPSGASLCSNPGTLELLPPGHVRDMRLTWNGTLDDGARVAPGSYVIAGAWTAAEDANMTKTAALTIEVV